MKSAFHICCLLFTLLLLTMSPARAQQAVFTKVPPPEGINWGVITGAAQDPHWFIWLATHDGLHRYDGYRYVSFYHDPNDINSLSSNRLESIYVSKSGIIWIGTFENGLDRYDPATNLFTHFSHDPEDPTSLSNNTVTVILEDRKGALWVGTHGGLNRFHPDSGTFTRYQHDPDDSTTLSNNQVRALYEDRQGTLWVGTGSPWESRPGEGGLNRFHPDKGTFTRYMHRPNDPASLIDNKVRAIFEDSRGTFWVGTLGDGLHTMDRRKGTFKRHRYDPSHPDRLSRSPISEGNLFDGVTFVHEDVTGAIWIGTNGGGVSRYDPQTGKVEHFVGNLKNSNGFPDRSIWWARNSKEGVLWMGTLDGNLFRTDPMRVSFAYQPTGARVFGIYEDATGNVWVGTEKGLQVYGKGQGSNTLLAAKDSFPASLLSAPVFAFLEDRRGTLWIGAESGLWRQEPGSKAFSRYDFDPVKPASKSDAGVISLHEGRDGYIWVGTAGGGLCRLNLKSRSFTWYKHDPGDARSLSSNFISAIQEDRQGNIWVGAWEGAGLNRLNPKTGKCTRYLQKGYSIAALREDASGRLWIGSSELGLFYYDKATDDIIRYKDKRTGKPVMSSVNGMMQDKEGNLWVSAAGGLSKLDPEGNLISTYGKEAGLNPMAFNVLATHTGKTGNLYVGDSIDFYTYLPQKNRFNMHPPHIGLTDFRLFDESVTPGTEGPLRVPVNQAREIVLSHNQNVFAFDFTGIHYTNPAQNRQFYMLENYDTDWRQAKSEPTAAYYNVLPGTYMFRVKAVSSEGVWSDKAVRVVIRAPWWKTWWAYGLYGLLLAGLIFTVDRVQRQRIIHRERERTRERELAQARETAMAYHELKRTQSQLIQSEKMASLGELTAGIAHEIQNPLNFVNNFSEVSSELVGELLEGPFQQLPQQAKEEAGEILESLGQNLNKIRQHGRRADAIVKNMLQHSRSSTGEKQLIDLNSLADEYLHLAYYGVRAKDSQFTCTLSPSYDKKLEKVKVAPQELGRVLLNLFNNAFYAVQQKQRLGIEGYKPMVSVTTRLLNGTVEIRVRDNGTGIPESVKSKIFLPFFTTKPSGQGTGLGLSLSYDIITKGHHGGDLSVATKEGEWTEFTITLPNVSVTEELASV